MDALERLVALEEIRSLIQTYPIAFDDHNWDALAAIFTEDVAFVAPNLSFEGRDTVLEFMRTCLPEDYRSKHFCAPPLIELAPDGRSATARTDVVWIAGNFENTIVARYNDELVKQDGRWLIRRRAETVVPYKPGPPPQSDEALTASGDALRT
jgi:uncharacterized protein (TIGR02246 family)